MRVAAVIGLAVVLAGCGSETPTPSIACPTEPPTALSAQATLVDAGVATVTVGGAVSGSFAIELRGDVAPIATANFVALARCGFYDRITFHRVLVGFVIQAGDPNTRDHDGDFSGIGAGGPGYHFAVEPPADDLAYDRYSVSMANSPVTGNGSQFFVALADLPRMPRDYTIFGAVISGTDIIDAIAALPVGDPRVGVPLTTVRIEGIVVSAADDS